MYLNILHSLITMSHLYFLIRNGIFNLSPYFISDDQKQTLSFFLIGNRWDWIIKRCTIQRRLKIVKKTVTINIQIKSVLFSNNTSFVHFGQYSKVYTLNEVTVQCNFKMLANLLKFLLLRNTYICYIWCVKLRNEKQSIFFLKLY